MTMYRLFTILVGVLISSALLVSVVADREAIAVGPFIDQAHAQAAPASETPKQRLAKVERWLLLLNNDLEDPITQRIASSAFDMAVVDDIATLEWNKGLDLGPRLDRLKRKPDGSRRIIISYLNAGQAEDYRAYFKPAWKTQPPSWIIGADPEGWEGNYPTAYWKPEWQAILLGPDGLAAQVARHGFDGAYLDWVAAYHDEAVQARALKDGVDARAEMAKLIVAIARAARAVNPDFILIAQNVPDMENLPEIVANVDGFVQEGIWFDGAQDDNPPGDCPLPRNVAEAGSPEYLARLPQACAKARAEGRANILNYVPYLTRARNQGLTVLTVDYALQPENIAEAVRLSRSFGFKPFAGARALKEYREPMF